jgi:hypothetical protein
VAADATTPTGRSHAARTAGTLAGQLACDLIDQAEHELARESDRLPEPTPAGDEHVPAETISATAGPLHPTHRSGERIAATYDGCESADHPHVHVAPVPGPQSYTAARSRAPGSEMVALRADPRRNVYAARGREHDGTSTDHHAERRLAGRGRLKRGSAP